MHILFGPIPTGDLELSVDPPPVTLLGPFENAPLGDPVVVTDRNGDGREDLVLPSPPSIPDGCSDPICNRAYIHRGRDRAAWPTTCDLATAPADVTTFGSETADIALGSAISLRRELAGAGEISLGTPREPRLRGAAGAARPGPRLARSLLFEGVMRHQRLPVAPADILIPLFLVSLFLGSVAGAAGFYVDAVAGDDATGMAPPPPRGRA